MTVTIKDIAKAAGVSHSTVSRALHGNSMIAAETIVRIQKIADELGYVPNTAARGLKTSRSGILGVIIRRIDDPFFAEVLHGIEVILQAEGYHLFLAASHRDNEREKTIIRSMSERRVDGVIFLSTLVDESHLLQLSKFKVPVVLVNNQAKEETVYSVYHDDHLGGLEMTRYLLSLGHKRIAYIGNARSGRITEDRQQGYLQALAEAGLSARPDYIVNGDSGLPASGAKLATYLLGLSDPPTAVFCYNDMVAVGVLKVARQSGLQLPHNLSVAGFDGIDLSAYTEPTLTTFSQPKYEIGVASAQMMLARLKEKTNLNKENNIMLRGHLTIRESTAPPNS